MGRPVQRHSDTVWVEAVRHVRGGRVGDGEQDGDEESRPQEARGDEVEVSLGDGRTLARRRGQSARAVLLLAQLSRVG